MLANGSCFSVRAVPGSELVGQRNTNDILLTFYAPVNILSTYFDILIQQINIMCTSFVRMKTIEKLNHTQCCR